MHVRVVYDDEEGEQDIPILKGVNITVSPQIGGTHALMGKEWSESRPLSTRVAGPPPVHRERRARSRSTVRESWNEHRRGVAVPDCSGECQYPIEGARSNRACRRSNFLSTAADRRTGRWRRSWRHAIKEVNGRDGGFDIDQ